jgi:uncharacterized membrane protein YdjX (TVP38/TMEM64 family)
MSVWKKIERLLAPVYATILIFIIIMIIHKDVGRFFSVDNARAFVSSFGMLSALVYIMIIVFFAFFEIIPQIMLFILGGFLFGTLQGALFGIAGSLCGSSLLFFAVNWLGHRRFVKEEKKLRSFKKLNELIKKDAVYAIYLAKLVPLFPNEILIIAASFSKVKFKELIMILLVGTLPSSIIGASLGNSFAEPKLTIGLVVFAFITSTIISVFIFRGHFHRSNKRDK